jgi:hypothetical protein
MIMMRKLFRFINLTSVLGELDSYGEVSFRIKPGLHGNPSVNPAPGNSKATTWRMLRQG